MNKTEWGLDPFARTRVATYINSMFISSGIHCNEDKNNHLVCTVYISQQYVGKKV